MSNDKPYPQSQDTPDPLAPAENNFHEGEDITSDPDDAVHNAKQKPSEENKQQDPDDAVHKGYKPKPISSHENDEKDPDDLVHGNG